MLQRTADWLEKMSVAAMAVGLFQGQPVGVCLGLACFAASCTSQRNLEDSTMATWIFAALACAGVFAYGLYLTRKAS